MRDFFPGRPNPNANNNQLFNNSFDSSLSSSQQSQNSSRSGSNRSVSYPTAFDAQNLVINDVYSTHLRFQEALAKSRQEEIMQKIKEMNQTISRLVDMTSNLAAREQVTTDKILYLQDTIMQHMEKQALEEGLDKKMMNEVQSHLADLSAELRSLKETSGKINSSPAKDKSG